MGHGASSLDQDRFNPDLPGGLHRWSREATPEAGGRPLSLDGAALAIDLSEAFNNHELAPHLSGEDEHSEGGGSSSSGVSGESSDVGDGDEDGDGDESEENVNHAQTRNQDVPSELPSVLAQHLLNQQYARSPASTCTTDLGSLHRQQLRQLQEDMEFAGVDNVNDVLARASEAGMLNTSEFYSDQSKLLEMFAKESLDEQLAILEFAYQEATNGDMNASNLAAMGLAPRSDMLQLNNGGDGSLDPYTSASIGRQAGASDDGIQVIRAWNLSLSSRCLRFSPNCATVFRQGQTGSFPAALVPVLSKRCDFTVSLEVAPVRTNWISFGLAIGGFSNEGGTRFGMASDTWGLFDRRNTLQPAEIWDRGKRVATCRPLKEEDEVAVSLDLDRGECSLMINGTLVHSFRGLDKMQCYVMGATLCDDHKLTIVGKKYSQESFGGLAQVLAAQTPGVPMPMVAAAQSTPPSSVLAISQGIRAGISEQLVARGRDIGADTDAYSGGAPVPATEAPLMPDALLCVICLDAAKSVLLLPCKHLAICPACDTHDMKTCPICRVRILDRLRVFVA